MCSARTLHFQRFEYYYYFSSYVRKFRQKSLFARILIVLIVEMSRDLVFMILCYDAMQEKSLRSVH